MIIIKWTILLGILLLSIKLGIAIANKYKYRVRDLKNIRSALSMLKTKMEYTYEPLPQIFSEIGNKFVGNIRDNL